MSEQNSGTRRFPSQSVVWALGLAGVGVACGSSASPGTPSDAGAEVGGSLADAGRPPSIDSGMRDAALPDATVGRDAGADAVGPVDADAGAPAVRFVGRTTGGATPSFEWEGSSVLANFTGTQVSVKMAGDATQPNYFAVIIDGKTQPTVVVSGASEATYPLATGLSAGQHSLVLFRRAEAFQGVTQFLGFDFGPGGKLEAPPPAATRRIEFIGDSITAGYGDECTNASTKFTAATENEYIAYGSIAARDLGAEAHVIAWSGEGVYRNCCGNTGPLMPAYWLATLPTDAASTWDFGTWSPDLVVVNLGTNDFSGTIPAGLVQQFQTSFTAFIGKVHQTYPQAYILCALGPVLTDPALTDARTAINGTIASVKSGGFARLSLVEFEAQNCGSDGSGCGCDYHPNSATQARVAKELEAAIHTAMGW